ncbi:MBL fold metallo-hydrolase [Streptomyces sp. PT12]|uniref:MBL fold metallo-hydrolase n=1 Tax=Streptomyces sp. PT12 TaxID=1510197 RepID=UPI000DE25E08|nr:MBL fold metallo-hydrolase [Streptomyces sp. PT12]RBM19453.1 MBL fold metallo-hydrolase [Streptomyces sp. PT12]
MLIGTVVADAWGTKCYYVARGPGQECVVVDPGMGVTDRLREAVEAHGLRPRAVLLTHGHLDHTHSAAAVSSAFGIPVYLHPADHGMLVDPIPGLGDEFGPRFERLLGPRWRWQEPTDVRPLVGGSVLECAGLALGVDHTPGHTPGSVMFNLSGDASIRSYCLVGDVVYAGSIGRTDMPGGSRAQTLASLRGLLAKPDDTVLLTGHEEDSTVGVERTANPFMRQAAASGPVG